VQRATSTFQAKKGSTVRPTSFFRKKVTPVVEDKPKLLKKPKTPLESLKELLDDSLKGVTDSTLKVEVVRNHDHIDPVDITIKHSLGDIKAIEALINAINKSANGGSAATTQLTEAATRLENAVKSIGKVGEKIQGEDLIVAVDELKEAVQALPKFDDGYLDRLAAIVEKSVKTIKVPKPDKVDVSPIVEAISLLSVQQPVAQVEREEYPEVSCTGYDRKLDRDGNVREVTFTYSDGSTKTMKATTSGYAIS
jgi:hypothetical protein